MKSIIKTIVALASVSALSFAGLNEGKGTSATVGKTAPDFSLTTASGESVSLSSFKGKEVVLEWVNFDCPFVKKHYDEGHMQKLQKEYAEKGVVWILVSSANEEHDTFQDSEGLAARAKKQKANATYSLVDKDGTVGKSYKAKTTPHMYVINKEGTLAYAGAIDSIKSSDSSDIAKSDNYVAAALDDLLAGKKVANPETKPYGCSVKYEAN